MDLSLLRVSLALSHNTILYFFFSNWEWFCRHRLMQMQMILAVFAKHLSHAVSDVVASVHIYACDNIHFVISKMERKHGPVREATERQSVKLNTALPPPRFVAGTPGSKSRFWPDTREPFPHQSLRRTSNVSPIFRTAQICCVQPLMLLWTASGIWAADLSLRRFFD